MKAGLADLAQRISQLDESRRNLLAWAEARDYCDDRYGAARLDYPPGSADVPGYLCEDIAYFVTVMEQVTDTGLMRNPQRMPLVSPGEADDLMANCRLLGRLADSVPEVTRGPLRRDAQYWVGTGGPGHLPSKVRELQRARFIDVAHAHQAGASTKPFGLGLFTSTGVAGTFGMWRVYLDLNRGSSLFPLPWQTWVVTPREDVAVAEITSAAEWVEFIASHPARAGEFLYPDWRQVADEYDGVHMSLRAIAAVQGLYFPVGNAIVVPSYWDVESTFWLRWCFTQETLVETARAD